MIQDLNLKAWGVNPYFKSEPQYIQVNSEYLKKQFAIFCDFITVLINSQVFEVKSHNIFFNNKKIEKFNLSILYSLILNNKNNELFLCKYLLNKINIKEIEKILKTLDLNLFKLTYERKS